MSKRKFNFLELASMANDPYNYGVLTPTFGKIRVEPKDRILIEKGGNGSDSIELYLDLLTDNQVYAQWDRQMGEIISKDWFLEPGGDTLEDKLALEYTEETLKSLSLNSRDYDPVSHSGILGSGQGLDGLTRGLGLALITGISPAEIIWRESSDRTNSYPEVDSVKLRDPRRFQFEADNQGNIFIKLKTKKYWSDGVYVPPRKFIIHRYWSVPSDDPYGNGVGRLLYYPVQWKRELLTLWLSIIDKYSNPTTVGTYERDITTEEQKEFDDALYNISRDMTISMPEGYKVDFISPNLSNVDLLSELEKVCNTYISKVISGEANTGEQNSEGSVKQTVSNSIRYMKAKSFSDLLSETLNNTLIKWIVNYRFPEAKPPKIWRNFNDVESVITLLTQIKSLGFTTTEEYVENITGIPIVNNQREKKSFSIG